MDKIAIVCSEFNKDLVEALYSQAYKEFTKYKSKAQNILSEKAKKSEVSPDIKSSTNKLRDTESKTFSKKLKMEEAIDKNSEKPTVNLLEPFWVPGAGEIPLAVKWLIETKKVHYVLALGVIIRGQTSHYDFLCNFLQRSLWDLQKTYSLPIIFSILTTENRKQAEERITQNRGAEGMKSLIQMMKLNYFILNYFIKKNFSLYVLSFYI